MKPEEYRPFLRHQDKSVRQLKIDCIVHSALFGVGVWAFVLCWKWGGLWMIAMPFIVLIEIGRSVTIQNMFEELVKRGKKL